MDKKEVPPGWQHHRLGHLGTWLSGGTPSKTAPDLWKGDIPWVSPKDMKRPRLWDALDHISQQSIGKGGHLAPAEALLIVVRGMILAHSAPIARAETSLAFNQDIKALVLRSTYDSNFMLWWLSWKQNAILNIATESTHGTKRIPTDSLFGMTVSLPPLPEQRAIATALTDVDDLLTSLDRLIAKKRAIKQGVMRDLLTGRRRLPGFSGEWQLKRLGDVAVIVMGQSPTSLHYNIRGDGLPLIQGNADVSNRRTIKRVFTTQITKRGLFGDILMSVRAPVGKVSRALFDLCLGRGVCALRFPNDFLYHFMIFHEPMWDKHSQGSTFDSVNSDQVHNVELLLPAEPSEQRAIAAVLTDMDDEIDALQARRDKTHAIKQGMMAELLTGRTRLV